MPDIIQDYRERERNPLPRESRDQNNRSHDRKLPQFHSANHNTAGSDNIRLPQSTKHKGKFNKNDSVPKRQRQLNRLNNPAGSRKRPSRRRPTDQDIAGILGPGDGHQSVRSTTSSTYAYLKDYDDQGKYQSIDHSINQSIVSQSISQSVSQSVNQQINKRSIDQ